MTAGDMGDYWDQRARENALFFVDNRLDYGSPESDQFWEYGEELIARLIETCDLPIGPEARILDLGCGIGRLTRPLAARAGEVVGVDVSAEMLELARNENLGLDNVDWLQGNGVGLEQLEDASIDGCVSMVVFQHIPDPAVTLGYVREIARVLRPGGWAALHISTDAAVHRPPGWAQRLTSQARGLMGRGPRGQDDPRWRGSAVSVAALRTTAHEAGLSLERVDNPGSLYTLVVARRTDERPAGNERRAAVS